MRIVTWTDKDGYLRRSWVHELDSDRDASTLGIPAGPPDLDQLDWEEIKKELHNGLAELGLATWKDVQNSQNGVTSVVSRVVKRRIIALYRQQEVQDA